MRHMCRTNLWFLCVEVLGCSQFDSNFHARMCRRHNYQAWPIRIDGSPLEYMDDAWPRGGFKTTLITVGSSIQAVLNWPEHHILINHAVEEGAMAIGAEIRSHCESNELLRWLFPDIFWETPKTQSRKWTQSELTLRRRKDWKEATFTFASSEQPKTGGHYSIIIYDDIVTEKNVMTKSGLEKIWSYWQGHQWLRDPMPLKKGDFLWYDWMPDRADTHFRVKNVFTCYDERDANSRRWHPDNPESLIYREQSSVHIQRALQDDGTSFFPSRFPVSLLKTMAEKDPRGFEYQMQQNPHPADQIVFDPNRLKRWSEKSLPPRMHYYTAVDPCGIPKKDALSEGDPGVVMTIGMSPLGNVYIMKIDWKKFTPTEHNRAVCDHIQLFKPKKLVIESTAYQSTFEFHLQEFAKTVGARLPTVVLKPRGGPESKTQRILGIETTWNAGRIYVNPSEQNHKEFVIQARKWKKRESDPDDMLDTLADGISVATAPSMTERAVATEAKKSNSKTEGQAVLDMLLTRRRSIAKSAIPQGGFFARQAR